MIASWFSSSREPQVRVVLTNTPRESVRERSTTCTKYPALPLEPATTMPLVFDRSEAGYRPPDW